MSHWNPETDPINPIAVYGTLRTGCGNDRLWRDRADSIGLGTVDGFRLVSNGAFPYAIPSPHPSARTVVELVMPWHGRYQEVIDRTDALEGVPHHYNRIEVAVQATIAQQTGVVFAWMYTPTNAERMARMDPVPGNDWIARHVRDWDPDELVRRVVG